MADFPPSGYILVGDRLINPEINPVAGETMQECSDEARRSLSLDQFVTPLEEGRPAIEQESEKKVKVKRKRRTKEELGQERRNALIAEEHALDAKSKTVNIGRCFLTDLRVGTEVWEELRARTIDSLELQARIAEGKAKRDGRKTILLQDII